MNNIFAFDIRGLSSSQSLVKSDTVLLRIAASVTVEIAILTRPMLRSRPARAEIRFCVRHEHIQRKIFSNFFDFLKLFLTQDAEH